LARALVRTAQKYNCRILSHGCTGKGVSQILPHKSLLDLY
jgi:argininosuccinate synthase